MKQVSLWTKTIRSLRLVLRSLSYVVTALVTLAYLLSAFSPYVSPFRFSPMALFGLMFPFFLVMQILVGAYWVIRQRWRIVVGLLIVFAISWTSISSYMPLHRGLNRQLESYQGSKLKILSYNVCGFGFEHHRAHKPNRVLLYLKGSDADIICLQEASVSDSPDWGVTRSQIKSYLGTIYPYIEVIPAQESGSELMILSRYPIKEAKRIPIRSRTNGAAYFKLNVGGQETHVINVHLESFRLSSTQGQEYMHLVSEGRAVDLQYALRSKLIPVFRRHAGQANKIKRYADSLKSDRLIICGDFNDTPVSYAHHKLAGGMTDAFISAGNGLGYSFVSRTFLVRIDHILLGRAFLPYYTRVDAGVLGSDHYPIYTYVKLSDQ